MIFIIIITNNETDNSFESIFDIPTDGIRDD